MPPLNADDFVRLVTLYVPETVTGLTFSPDGSLIAVASGDKVHIFKVPPQVLNRPATTDKPANS